MIIFLRNCILCCKPQILFCIQSVGKAASCKAFDGFIDIMHSLYDSRSIKLMNQFFCLASIFCCVYKFNLSRSRNLHLGSFIYISISMSCNCNWFLPVLYTWLNSFYNDWSAEHCSIKDRTDCSVRALPHFFQIILIHTCCIRSDCCTFYGNFVFLCCECGINCYLVICLVSVFQAEIIIFCLEINIWLKKIILDHLPENSCHLISIHLYQWCCHLNFFHLLLPPDYVFLLFSLDSA